MVGDSRSGFHAFRAEKGIDFLLDQGEHIPTLLKMELEGGGVVLKFHFKIPFLQSCFLNDQYSSSFHVNGKQVKIKYLRLAPEELSTCQTEAAHV